MHASGNAAAGGAGFGAGLLARLYPEVTTGPRHLVAFPVLGLIVITATRARLGWARIGSRRQPVRTSTQGGNA